MATEKQCSVVMELFETCFDRVYGFVRKFADPESSEEIAQEVFCRLLSLQDFEKKDLSVSYLIKIADNLLKRRFKRQQRLKRFGEEVMRGSPSQGWAKTARTEIETDDARVSAAMSHLSGDEREAVRLIVCEGLSYESAARSLGVEVSTINNWKHRGIQKLKQHVGSERGRRGDDAADAPVAGRRSRSRQGALPEGPARRYGRLEEDI